MLNPRYTRTSSPAAHRVIANEKDGAGRLDEAQLLLIELNRETVEVAYQPRDHEEKSRREDQSRLNPGLASQPGRLWKRQDRLGGARQRSIILTMGFHHSKTPYLPERITSGRDGQQRTISREKVSIQGDQTGD